MEMSRLSLAFLIVTSLALTAYFGSVAWRLSDDSDHDITNQISAGQSNGWSWPRARRYRGASIAGSRLLETLLWRPVDLAQPFAEKIDRHQHPQYNSGNYRRTA